MDLIDQIFGTSQGIAPLQECARAVVVFFYGLLLLRMPGRRTFGKWSTLDIVVSIVAGSALARAMTGGAPFVGTLLAVTVFVAIYWVLAHAAARSRTWSRIVEGVPVALAIDGRVAAGKLKANAISETDLAEALRMAGLTDVAQARLVMLEPSGKITVLKA